MSSDNRDTADDRGGRGQGGVNGDSMQAKGAESLSGVAGRSGTVTPAPSDHYDVAILGTGIGGTILGAILARHGARVLLVERGSHPRFAIGESTVPETTFLLRLLGERYGVPEITYLSTHNRLRARVSSACGVKRNFTFVYHRPGQVCNPHEITQFPTWAPPFGPDVHYFRQDVDAYMFGIAVRYGAEACQETNIREIDFSGEFVRLVSDRGRVFRARYVIDAGGMNAPLAQQFSLREEQCSLATRSRTLFTHMVGVEPFDRCGPDRRSHALPSPLSQGTLHHVFKGGWMWVIPFDNHPSSTNPLCSVGVTFDLDANPARGLPPEQEFREFLGRFPSVARQFEHARPVRPWIATGRLQYASRQIVGDRYCLLPHAASFVDPLFSSGLGITFFAINGLAHRLLSAIGDGDFSAARFAPIDTWVRRSFAYYDTLVSTSYRSWGDYDLWNAWHRIWMLGSTYGPAGLFEVLSMFTRTGDPAAFALFDEEPYRGLQAFDLPPYARLFEDSARQVAAYHEGKRSAREATQEIYALIRASGLAPAPWNLLNPEHRWPTCTFTAWPMARLIAWGMRSSPEVIQRHYFGGRSNSLWTGLLRVCTDELGPTTSTTSGIKSVLRDSVLAWNDDWRA
jgi:FADH2 O2-dependent halogenase